MHLKLKSNQINMKIFLKFIVFITVGGLFALACSNSDDSNSTDDMGVTEDEGPLPTELHDAFSEFDPDYTDIYLDGYNVVIETLGVPNHLTPYYSSSHPLYVEPTVTSEQQMTPTRIDNTNRDYEGTLIVSASPELASFNSATQLGSIGIAVSGAYIFNDQEGNGPLDSAAGSLDYTGAHIGPSVYHYHLEPLAFTNDDGNLVGIISDGFFIYGRRDYPSNDYPTDLDESGGHFGPTPHNPDGEYHYHIINEVYGSLGRYLLFAGPYQGTPNAIN